MKDYQILIGENIRYFRKKNGNNRTKLAELAELSNAYITEIESGRKTPSLKVLIRIAQALAIEPYRLLMDPANQTSEVASSKTDDLISDITKLIAQYKT